MPSSNLETYAFELAKVKWLSTEPFVVKLRKEPLSDVGMKVRLNVPGHMTRMAAMLIYGKTPSNIFLSGTSGLITLKLGM